MIKVAFIVCYNNELYINECLNYISWLKVPEGVEVETIGITDADSMSAGYNTAMYSTNAKYKVYLHQDVFILNENFIRDILYIFNQEPHYGMIGVLGSNRIVKDGCYWIAWNIGKVYAWNSAEMTYIKLDQTDELITETESIDGMIMITQYDIPWNQDVFDGFDFYDVSQSKEFLKRGYKVGVINQEQPWCIHDCGASKLVNYDFYRKKFCETYKDLGYGYKINEDLEFHSFRGKVVENILPQITAALECGDYENFRVLLYAAIQYYPSNTKISNLYVISEIIQMEKIYGKESFFVKGMSVDELLNKYTLYRFLLIRMEFNKTLDSMYDVLQIIAENNMDFAVEKIIAKHTVLDDRKTMHKLIEHLKYDIKRENND